MMNTYLNLLEQEWKMNDIDNMDIIYYFELMLYKLEKKESEQTGFIDNVL